MRVRVSGRHGGWPEVVCLLIAVCAGLGAGCGDSAGPSGAADGMIAFVSSRDGNLDIFSMDAYGRFQTNLTHDPEWADYPDWSPDGDRIAFVSGRDGVPNIYTMHADGTHIRKLTTGTGNLYANPVWSPDGTKIAYAGGVPLDIFVMSDIGTGVTNLTNTPLRQELDPSWSPDGLRIAYEAGPSSNREIYVMDADGSNPTQITDDPADDRAPSWSPDYCSILFSSRRDGATGAP